MNSSIFGTSELTFGHLRTANVARLLTTEKYATCLKWTQSQWLQALVGEIGEYANLMKKVERGDYELDVARVELGKELADVVIYLDLLSYNLGIDLGHATRVKFNEVSERVNSRIWIEYQNCYCTVRGIS